MAHQFAQIKGTSVHYDLRGDGHPLVLIHSGVSDLCLWDDQMDDLAAQHYVIRYDVRGHGKTPCPPGNYSHHQDLRALLDYLDVRQAAVLGCSIGGGIAIDFALAYPARVSFLIPVASALGGLDPDEADITAKEERERLFSEVDAAYDQGDFRRAAHLLARVWVDGPKRLPDQVDPKVRERAMGMMMGMFDLPEDEGTEQSLEPPAASRLAEIEVPTLVIVGDYDDERILMTADYLAEGITNVRKVVLPGLAHYPNMERPAEFNRVVLDFLAARDK
jgi:pimeloyl-ACP methyl ester carboxylesterase